MSKWKRMSMKCFCITVVVVFPQWDFLVCYNIKIYSCLACILLWPLVEDFSVHVCVSQYSSVLSLVETFWKCVWNVWSFERLNNFWHIGQPGSPLLPAKKTPPTLLKPTSVRPDTFSRPNIFPRPLSVEQYHKCTAALSLWTQHSLTRPCTLHSSHSFIQPRHWNVLRTHYNEFILFIKGLESCPLIYKEQHAAWGPQVGHPCSTSLLHLLFNRASPAEPPYWRSPGPKIKRTVTKKAD